MNFGLFVPVLLAFLLNLVSYVLYKIFLEKRLNNILAELEILEKKIETIRSEKRRVRKLRLKDAEIRGLYGAFRNLMFLQMVTLLTLYFIGFIITTYIKLNVYFPYYIPGITNGKYNEILGGNILVYIIAFFMFIPIGSRRPKIL